MKKLLLLLCFVFIHQVVYPVYFKHLGMSDGLSQVSVMSIYQDCLGRMWFGTREGVYYINWIDYLMYEYKNTTTVTVFSYLIYIN